MVQMKAASLVFSDNAAINCLSCPDLGPSLFNPQVSLKSC